MFPHTTLATPSKDTLPRHLWPKSVRHDVSNLRRRAKAIRRLVKYETKRQVGSQNELLPEDPSLPLWASVATPLSLKTALSPPPKSLDTLGVLVRLNTLPMGTTSLHATQDCFTRLGKATRLLIRHARNFRRLKYGKALLRISVKNPSVALKFILRSAEETTDNPTLPTDLSILRDGKSGRLLTTP